MVGGKTWSRSARTLMPASRPPAPPSKCPVIDFVELTASFLLVARSPNSLFIAVVSITSPRGIDVANVIRRELRVLQRAFHHAIRAIAILLGLCNVVRVAAHPVAHNFRQD